MAAGNACVCNRDQLLITFSFHDRASRVLGRLFIFGAVLLTSFRVQAVHLRVDQGLQQMDTDARDADQTLEFPLGQIQFTYDHDTRSTSVAIDDN